MQLSRDIEIINKLGMHARAAAKFVKLASSFESQVEIERAGRRVNGTCWPLAKVRTSLSILMAMMQKLVSTNSKNSLIIDLTKTNKQ